MKTNMYHLKKLKMMRTNDIEPADWEDINV